jgi:hypothetical protein
MFHEKRELEEQITHSIEVVDLWLSKMTIQYLCHYGWSYTCKKIIEAIEL